jgi:hypothetical protein
MTGSGARGLYWNPRGKDEATLCNPLPIGIARAIPAGEFEHADCMAQEPLRVDVEIMRPAKHEI